MIIYLFISMVPLKAWNKLWEHPTEAGRIRTPVICRNMNNTGLVTASYWVHDSLPTTIEKPRLKFIETDDAGNDVTKKEIQFYYENTGVVPENVVLHQIAQNPFTSGYILFGAAYEPNSFTTTRSFLMHVDTNLDVQGLFFLGDRYQFFDMTITPVTHRIILSGMNNYDQGLTANARNGVIAVFDQTIALMNVYDLSPSAGGTTATVPRFDNAKCVTSWADNSNQEHVAVAGSYTNMFVVGVDTHWVPQLFVCRLNLDSLGALSHNWQRIINDELNQQLIPMDILADTENEKLVVCGINHLAVSGNTPSSCVPLHEGGLVLFNFNGGLFDYQYKLDGALSYPEGLGSFQPIQCAIKDDTSYIVFCTVDRYRLNSTQFNNVFNFGYFEYSLPSSKVIRLSLKAYVGNTSNYASTILNDFYGTYLNDDYTCGSTVRRIKQYHTPHFGIVWKDAQLNSKLACSWVHQPNVINLIRYDLRIISTVTGFTDSIENCDYLADSVESDVASVNIIELGNPWSSALPFNISSPQLRVPDAVIPEQEFCDGEND